MRFSFSNSASPGKGKGKGWEDTWGKGKSSKGKGKDSTAGPSSTSDYWGKGKGDEKGGKGKDARGRDEWDYGSSRWRTEDSDRPGTSSRSPDKDAGPAGSPDRDEERAKEVPLLPGRDGTTRKEGRGWEPAYGIGEKYLLERQQDVDEREDLIANGQGGESNSPFPGYWKCGNALWEVRDLYVWRNGRKLVEFLHQANQGEDEQPQWCLGDPENAGVDASVWVLTNAATREGAPDCAFLRFDAAATEEEAQLVRPQAVFRYIAPLPEHNVNEAPMLTPMDFTGVWESSDGEIVEVPGMLFGFCAFWWLFVRWVCCLCTVAEFGHLESGSGIVNCGHPP